LLIRELKPDIPHDVLSLLSTALLFGIQSDTNQFTHANETDYDALQYLTHYSSGEIINKITHTPLSKITIGLLWEAIENQVLYRDWLIAGIGFVNELQRDSIAVIADFLLNREDVSTVVVFAIIEKNNREGLTLDVSIRSVDGTLNLNELIKKITQQGGARKFKGAYQISLDYFIHAPDREVLWKLVQRTTIEVIKKRRDSLTIPAFKGFYNKFKNWLGNFWE
jgi:nanoRNase/pAp phosphatase (c-di-AMP/oligoRNAs hydrolase)